MDQFHSKYIIYYHLYSPGLLLSLAEPSRRRISLRMSAGRASPPSRILSRLSQMSRPSHLSRLSRLSRLTRLSQLGRLSRSSCSIWLETLILFLVLGSWHGNLLKSFPGMGTYQKSFPGLHLSHKSFPDMETHRKAFLAWEPTKKALLI